MKITVEGESKEIAALVVALQERQTATISYTPTWTMVEKMMREHPELFTTGALDSQDV